MDRPLSKHSALIVDQFTKQSETFATAPALSDSAAMELLVKACQVTRQDIILDVACGAGIVACYLAHLAHHVTGIDITPAMIELCRDRQSKENLNNLSWHLGEVLPLPMTDATFTLVTSRYAFHHFTEPAKIFQEMARVCVPGGRIAIVDVTPQPETLLRYNEMEKLRDPSHAAALTFDEFLQMGAKLGLKLLSKHSYSMNLTVDQVLSASFPNSGDDQRIREQFEEDAKTGCLGVGTFRKDGQLHFGYPISIIIWNR